jgi:catechol 2,3-dioxygenase-like lactoylglutathione lyase family enzyme
MPVKALDHVNIRTRDIAASARFYAELLDLTISNAPSPMTAEQALWLRDSGGRAIIHLVSHQDEKGAPGPTGPIDHIAFSCTGKQQLLERLTQRGAEFAVHDMADGSRTLVFTRDPHGVMLELNFDAD